jgi:hypothetical protein
MSFTLVCPFEVRTEVEHVTLELLVHAKVVLATEFCHLFFPLSFLVAIAQLRWVTTNQHIEITPP